MAAWDLFEAVDEDQDHAAEKNRSCDLSRFRDLRDGAKDITRSRRATVVEYAERSRARRHPHGMFQAIV
jgi:hypothetical protein